MYITLTNTSDDTELVSSPDGKVLAPLYAQTPWQINDDGATVLLVGDKPGMAEVVEAAGRAVGTILHKLIQLVLGRKGHAVENTGHPEEVRIAVSNHGPRDVRVILGDGVNDVTIGAGATKTCIAVGYIELRELGLLQ